MEKPLIKKTFIVAMKEYFGYRPGENLSGFNKEIKDLSDEDRQEFKNMLATVGYEITN